MFEGMRRNHYAAILADPPWRFKTWDKREAIPKTRSIGCTDVSEELHYRTMSFADICALPVGEHAAENCVLFLWVTWPQIVEGIDVAKAWGFEFKTAAFVWTKARARQIEMFDDDVMGTMGMGYWTRANTEACLLFTRGRPKRINADVRQVIIEPRREHSRKPDCVHDRIERLVEGPYLELFARKLRSGWTCVGDQVDKFREAI